MQRDFSQRDKDFEHLYELLSRFLPHAMLRLLHEAISLNQMTNDLDRRLLQVLEDHLGVEVLLSEESYAQAYRQCDNYAERLEQIERLVAIVREIGAGAQLRVVVLPCGCCGCRLTGWVGSTCMISWRGVTRHSCR